MKKIIAILILSAVLLAGCSAIEGLFAEEPTPLPPTPTPMPTATPDPCAPDNLLEQVEQVQNVVNAFQDVAYVANFTPQTELIMPILNLQDIRRELQDLQVPECEDAIKSAALNYMNATINYLAFFMGGESQENVDAGIQNSQVLWQVLLEEFSKLLGDAGLIDAEVPDINSSMPTITDSGIFVTNEETSSVNVRNQPDENAEIITAFEPGMQAAAVGRNEAGDWLMINLDGVTGWVFAEVVTASEDTADLTVVEPEQ